MSERFEASYPTSSSIPLFCYTRSVPQGMLPHRDMKKSTLKATLLIVLAGCLSHSRALADEEAFPEFEQSVYAEGLEQPDGLAINPLSGELYVSEESAGRICVIRNGRPKPVVTDGFRVRGEVPASLLSAERPSSFWLGGQLKSPEGIAFGPDNHLYVVEDSAHGRLLRFEGGDAEGRFTNAQLVPIPELGEPYAWEGICFAPDGRLFLAGSSIENSTTWGYSCVLARDATQTWWMVDYGPLASFSAVTLAENDNVLVVGDESVGSLTWWDIEKHAEIQTLTKSLGAIEGLCVLPDGSLVVAVEHASDGGRLVRVNPATGGTTEIASGLGTIETVICDPRTGKLFVSEDSTGRILCFTPRAPISATSKLLSVTRRSGEARHGQTARETPPFLKQFMGSVGVDIVDEDGEPSAGSANAKNRQVTMEELGKRIPMVAGRVTVQSMPGHSDPVEEINFLSLYPNQITGVEKQPVPSLCFFSARHKSGKVDRTHSMGAVQARRIGPDGRNSNIGAESFMMAPLSTCSAVENENGVTVVVTFLGLENFDDYFLTLNYGRTNEAFLATSGKDFHVARADFSERGKDGSEVFNFAMTGVRVRRMEEATWMRLQPQANWTLLTPGFDAWVSRRSIAVMPELVAKFRRYNHYVIDALLADVPGDPPGTMTQKVDAEPPPQAKSTERKEATSPAAVMPPVADLRIASPREDDDVSFTNILLSRIAQAWDKGWSR